MSFGLYTGILFGFRTYEEKYKTSHVFYIPFIDICLTIHK